MEKMQNILTKISHLVAPISTTITPEGKPLDHHDEIPFTAYMIYSHFTVFRNDSFI